MGQGRGRRILALGAPSDARRLRVLPAEHLANEATVRNLQRQPKTLSTVERNYLEQQSARHDRYENSRSPRVLSVVGRQTQLRERDLRDAIVAHLKDFILEFGNDFSIVGQEYRLQVGSQDFFVDLLMHNRKLACLTGKCSRKS